MKKLITVRISKRTEETISRLEELTGMNQTELVSFGLEFLRDKWERKERRSARDKPHATPDS